MSLSIYCMLSISSVVVQVITSHHTYAHKLVLILLIYFPYLVSIAYPVLFHITCIYSLTEKDSSFSYPVTVCLESVSIEGSSHVYKTCLLASAQIVNQAIFPACVLCYCYCLLMFNYCHTCYLPLPLTMFFFMTLS